MKTDASIKGIEMKSHQREVIRPTERDQTCFATCSCPCFFSPEGWRFPTLPKRETTSLLSKAGLPSIEALSSKGGSSKPRRILPGSVLRIESPGSKFAGSQSWLVIFWSGLWQRM